MLGYLVEACRAARQSTNTGQTTIAALLGLNQSSVARFEAGAAWPRDPDHYVAAYAAAGHVGPAAIWQDALNRLTAAEPGAATPDGVPPEMQAVEQALAAAAKASVKGARRTAASKRGRLSS